jgi:hypothetical protein
LTVELDDEEPVGDSDGDALDVVLRRHDDAGRFTPVRLGGAGDCCSTARTTAFARELFGAADGRSAAGHGLLAGPQGKCLGHVSSDRARRQSASNPRVCGRTFRRASMLAVPDHFDCIDVYGAVDADPISRVAQPQAGRGRATVVVDGAVNTGVAERCRVSRLVPRRNVLPQQLAGWSEFASDLVNGVDRRAAPHASRRVRNGPRCGSV